MTMSACSVIVWPIRVACPPQVWNLEAMQVGSPPPLLQTLKPFATNQKMPEASITCIAVHEASWPRFTVAVGLATSKIYILRGGSGEALALSAMALCMPKLAHDLLDRRSFYAPELAPILWQYLCVMWHSIRVDAPSLTLCCRSRSTSAAHTGKERLQRSVLHMRDGAVGEELVGLAFKGAYVRYSPACKRMSLNPETHPWPQCNDLLMMVTSSVSVDAPAH